MKKCQKDIDARWTQKRGKNYFGYKNHIEVDVQLKIIRDYRITDAAVHNMTEVKLGLRSIAYNMDKFCTLMLQNA